MAHFSGPPSHPKLGSMDKVSGVSWPPCSNYHWPPYCSCPAKSNHPRLFVQAQMEASSTEACCSCTVAQQVAGWGCCLIKSSIYNRYVAVNSNPKGLDLIPHLSGINTVVTLHLEDIAPSHHTSPAQGAQSKSTRLTAKINDCSNRWCTIHNTLTYDYPQSWVPIYYWYSITPF